MTMPKVSEFWSRMTSSQQSFELADARAAGGRIVHLRFEDGEEFDPDLAPDLKAISGPLVDGLRIPGNFARLQVQHGLLIFPTGLDYGADVLCFWCENGGVADQDKNDELAARYIPSVLHRPQTT